MSMQQLQGFQDLTAFGAEPRPMVAPVPLTRSLGRIVRGCGAVVAAELRARRAAHDLAEVSDATLRDLGLARADIERRVRGG